MVSILCHSVLRHRYAMPAAVTRGSSAIGGPCLSVRPSVCLSVWLSVRLSVGGLNSYADSTALRRWWGVGPTLIRRPN